MRMRWSCGTNQNRNERIDDFVKHMRDALLKASIIGFTGRLQRLEWRFVARRQFAPRFWNLDTSSSRVSFVSHA
jgi:hypothetical protein